MGRAVVNNNSPFSTLSSTSGQYSLTGTGSYSVIIGGTSCTISSSYYNVFGTGEKYNSIGQKLTLEVLPEKETEYSSVLGPGISTFTGGSAIYPLVNNITAGTSSIVTSNFINVSGSTNNLENIFRSPSMGGEKHNNIGQKLTLEVLPEKESIISLVGISLVGPGISTFIGATSSFQTVNISAFTPSSAILSGRNSHILATSEPTIFKEKYSQPIKDIKVRYNHNRAGDYDMWRIFIDGKEHTATKVIFKCPTETTIDYDEESLGYKAHISCKANDIQFDKSKPFIIVVTIDNKPTII